MAKTGVLGNGPISFFNKATHGQVSIPLSALIFDNGKLVISQGANRPDLLALDPGLTTWLNYIAGQGFVVPAPTPPAAQALVFTAADPGVTGNDVTVEIVFPPGPTYTAKVTKTDRYTGLKAGNIGNVLGLAGPPVVPGSQPGLVHVKTLAVTTLADRTATPDPAATVGPTDAAAINFDFGGGSTLVLAASKPGPDGKKISVTIKVTDVPSGTFSLTATWTTTITIDTTALPSAWATAFLGAGYVLSVSAPPPATTLGLPQAGIYVLSGGADAAPAASATATAVAAS
jgi:hypothetical protein